MWLFRPAQLCALLAIVASAGCQTPPRAGQQAPTKSVQAAAPPVATAPPARDANIVTRASFQAACPCREMGPCDPLFAGDPELLLPKLQDAVLARNPSLQTMIASWRAAAERYPQVISLDDPM